MDSLAPLFRSNDAPLPSQTIIVREILQDKKVELSALGDEISRLELTLRALRRKYADLVAEVNQYSSILSPIRTLPHEIIGEIFLYFSPSMDNTHAQVRLPWKLGHICYRWRTIAFALGELWPMLDLRRRSYQRSQLGLRPRDEEFADGLGGAASFVGSEDVKGFEIATTLDYIEGYLQRFGNRPLSFRLWAHDFAVSILLEALLKHSALWKEMVLVDLSPVRLDRLSHSDVDLRGLHKIAFVCTTHLLSHHIFPYRVTPHLTDLALVRVSIPRSTHSHIPWANLIRYCEIGCAWPSGDQERLASYRKLTNLRTLRMELSQYRFLETNTPLFLPNLRAASLHFLEPCITKLMQSFEMPALEDFTILYCGDVGKPLGFLIPRSSPRLKSLRVRACSSFPFDHDPDDLDCALELFWDLKEIVIDVPDLISHSFVSRLIPYDDQLSFAPKLEIIRFSNSAFVDKSCKWQTLVELLRSRFRPTVPGISRLRTFGFYIHDWSNDVNVTSGLKALGTRNNWDIRIDDTYRFPAWSEPRW
ncbi:hypothetical protein DFH08DRAFT_774729 [Mycena albidolilacea]|uniref:F-box domain-containing protein n=1 Tax=Mycena albidolilacea TaxID=1033008 RepID=A0AAD7AAT0_9AGAR|nr:hypothetical protein DFH08DRAFT_774729 [Mycena albidolilacea]